MVFLVNNQILFLSNVRVYMSVLSISQYVFCRILQTIQAKGKVFFEGTAIQSPLNLSYSK